MNAIQRVALSAIVVLVAAPATAQDIDTRTVSGTDDRQGYLGVTGYGGSSFSSEAWGQTFTATGTQLDAFSFFLGWPRLTVWRGDELRYRAYVAEWIGAAPGAVLWSSDLVSGTADGTIREYAFDVGALVDPGAVYVAFLAPVGVECSWLGCGANMQSVFRMTLNGGYTGGSAVSLNQSRFGGSDWSSYSWATYDGTNFTNDLDAEFTASFSGTAPPPTVTPEPVSMLLLGTGLFGVAGVARRRRRDRDELA